MLCSSLIILFILTMSLMFSILQSQGQARWVLREEGNPYESERLEVAPNHTSSIVIYSTQFRIYFIVSDCIYFLLLSNKLLQTQQMKRYPFITSPCLRIRYSGPITRSFPVGLIRLQLGCQWRGKGYVLILNVDGGRICLNGHVGY